MIDNGDVKNQARLARLKGISRARVTQILRLLKLDSLIIQRLEKLGDPLRARTISERMLRPYTNKSIRTSQYFKDPFLLNKDLSKKAPLTFVKELEFVYFSLWQHL